MIHQVIKFPSGVVIVFEEKGEQIPEYQGSYDRVIDIILRDAPLSAEFYHAKFELAGGTVPREQW